MHLFKLNGWLRLYISLFVFWFLLSTFNFFSNLPTRSNMSILEQQGLLELTSEIERIQNISPVEDLFKASDQVCDAAFENGGMNKNECMEFMLNPKALGLTSRALTGVRIVSPNVKDRALRLKQQEDNVFLFGHISNLTGIYEANFCLAVDNFIAGVCRCMDPSRFSIRALKVK